MSALGSPLRLRVGYRFTLSQLLGNRPQGRMECTGCADYDKTVEVPITTEPAETGEAVNAAIADWLAHWVRHHEPAEDATNGIRDDRQPTSAYPEERCER